MSDADGHEFSEDHVRPVDLKDIPQHTWVVTTSEGVTKTITTHMAIRPDEALDAWRFVQFVDIEDGWRVEQTLDAIAADEVTSVVWVKPDGSRKEMVG